MATQQARNIIRWTIRSFGAAILAALIAACSGNLLTEIRIASVPAGAEIAVLVDGAAVDTGSETDLGVWPISGAARSITVTIRNTGEADLELQRGAVSLSGDATFSIRGLTTALRLAPGASDSFDVVFDPVSATTSGAVISVQSNDPDRPTFSFTLQGTGSNIAVLYSSVPGHNATGVQKGSDIEITYSKLLDDATIDAVSGTANITISPSVPFDESSSDVGGRTMITLKPYGDLDQHLNPGTQYTVRINQNDGARILDTEGLAAHPVTIAFTVLPLPSAPGSDPTPTPNTIWNPLVNPVTLDWPDFPDATSYVLRYKSATAGSWSTVNKAAATSHQIACGENIQYLWYVTATNDSGSFDYPGSASPWTFTAGYYKPAAPALVLPANGATGVSTSSVTLDWNSATYAQTYTVYYRPSALDRYISASGLSATEYTLTDLVEGETFYWYVRAYREGNSTASSVRSFTTEASLPAPSDVDLTVSLGKPLLLGLTWSYGRTSPEGWHIQLREGGTALFPNWEEWGVDFLDVPGSSRSASVPASIDSGTHIQARIRAYNGSSFSLWVLSDAERTP